jgi:hypothetical protein
MKAITILQPWPEIILADHGVLERHGLGPPKRVENRTRKTSHRGTFLIHAGKNRSGVRENPWLLEVFPEMAFGAIVGKADLVACFTKREIDETVDELGLGWPFAWVQSHRWTEGPALWILDKVERLARPIPCNGSQGWWNYEGPLALPAAPLGTAVSYGGQASEFYPNQW